ncbi:MAG: response regulator [Actinobacteria bacterium]|jgi:CheY-like chemotaxis protein|nr:response regulator [Actinomycetota bacterium]
MSSQWSILFVDDDRDFLDAQAAYFSSRGHTVHTAESSREALDLIETTIPDIIFLDLMIEHYDSGFRLAYQIRRHEHLDNTPVVLLTGVARETGERFDQEDEGLPRWSRLDRFVDKPVTGRQLLGIAEELLAAKGDQGA